MRAAIVLVALVLVACHAKPAVPPAVAPSSAAAPTERPALPGNPFEAIRATFPEPNVKAAFVLDADVEYGMDTKGRLRITAQPGMFEGRPAWVVEESEELPAFVGLGTEATSDRRTIWLSRDLRVLRREAVVTSASETVATVCTPSGTKVTKTVVGREPETWTLVAGTAAAGMDLAAALIYLRMCPAAVIDPGAEQAGYPRVASVEPDGALKCTFGPAAQTFIDFRAPDRAPVRIEEYAGGHHWRTVVARPSSRK